MSGTNYRVADMVLVFCITCIGLGSLPDYSIQTNTYGTWAVMHSSRVGGSGFTALVQQLGYLIT